MTEYVIFERFTDEESEMWRYRGHEEARSASSAIRSFLNGANADGIYVAAPARSWRPVTVKVETKTALKFL